MAVRILVKRPKRKTTMDVITTSGRRISLLATPPQFDYSNVARLGQVDRDGKKTLTRRVGPGLATLSFTTTAASLDYQVSIESAVAALQALARDGKKVRFTGGSPQFEQANWWHIKGLGVGTVQRATNNQPSRVALSWQLEEAVDVTTKLVKPRPNTSRSVSTRARQVAKTSRTHRVVRGDTLWHIARRYLGNPTRYPEIVRANKIIKNPNLIYPGWVLKIPAR